MSTATEMFGPELLTEQSCETARTRAAWARRFFIAITSFTHSALIRSGIDGPVLSGRRLEWWIRVVDQRHHRRLHQPPRRLLLLRRLESRRITRASRRLLKLLIAPVLSGLVRLTERSCATVSRRRAASVLKFFIAITSFMSSAPTHNGIAGLTDG